jgi:hypothetical protein
MGRQATWELVDGFVDTLVVELRRGICSVPSRAIGCWLEIIRIVGSCATRERAQEKRIGDMPSLLYQYIVEIVATNETSVHTVNALIVRGSCHG